MIAWLTFAVTVFSAALAPQTPAPSASSPPPRDARPTAPAGAASISGIVTTGDPTPQPLRHATITLTPQGDSSPVSAPGVGDSIGFTPIDMTASREAGPATSVVEPIISRRDPGARSMLTDAEGRFSFEGLLPGRYTLSAFKPGYVRIAYGAKQGERPGTPISLTSGQQLTIALTIPRGAVLAGALMDDAGLPAANTTVSALHVRHGLTGDRAFSRVRSTDIQATTVTDDRGYYRLFGLPAGEYVVVATPAIEGGDAHATTADDLALVSAASELPPAPEPVTVGYSPVYFPGTTAPRAAAGLTLAVSEERDGVNFQLQRVPTARIDGTVVAPNNGNALQIQLLLEDIGADAAIAGPAPALQSTAAFGRGFSFSGVAPGSYRIRADVHSGQVFFDTNRIVIVSGPMTSWAVRPGTPDAAHGEPALWGQLDLEVNGRNLSGLSLGLQPALSFSGRLAFEGSSASPDLSDLELSLVPVGLTGRSMLASSPRVQVTGDSFTVSDLAPGRYQFVAHWRTPQANWTLKSAIVDGEDALDRPLDVGPTGAPRDATLIFSRETQKVSGRLEDASGRPAPDYTMVVFPSDPALWLAGDRRVRAARPSTDGTFVIADLPAGEYRIAAVTDLAPDDLDDREFLQALAGVSLAFSLGPGESKVQDFKLAQ